MSKTWMKVFVHSPVVLGALVASFVTLVAAASTATAQSNTLSGSPNARVRARAFELREMAVREGTVSVIVATDSGMGDVSRRAQRLRAMSDRGLRARALGSLPMASVRVTAAELDRLATTPGIVDIWENGTYVQMLDVSVPLIGGGGALSGLPVAGEGARIAVIDSGVEASHPAFGNRVVAEACFADHDAVSSTCPNQQLEEFGPGAATPCLNGAAGPFEFDFNGTHLSLGECRHGTAVASVAAGEDATITGVAPEAEIVAINVFHRSQCLIFFPCLITKDELIIDALDWIRNNQATLGVDVVNMSLGTAATTFSEACDDTALANAIRLLFSGPNEVAIVVATGNSGASNGIASPACVSGVLSVGASNDSDQLWSGSNSHEMLRLLAPGQDIYSVFQPGYSAHSGTSLAAPHVAGAVALLRSFHPTMSVPMIRDLLSDTGRHIRDTRNGIVRPRILVSDAIFEELDGRGPEVNDSFGYALAGGDFDANGSADVLAGAEGEMLFGDWSAGEVSVHYKDYNHRSSSYSDQLDVRTFHQGRIDVFGDVEPGDGFGSALAVGDFNNDGVDDAAIGIPGEDSGSIVDSGMVSVFYGSPTFGLTTLGHQSFEQGLDGLQGARETGDRFGQSLAVGDFNGDGFDDLVVGVPFEDVGTAVDSGAVHVLYGSATGITTTNNKLFTQGDEVAEADDWFGHSLATGRFNNDALWDLAIGAPLENVSTFADAGQVTVYHGTTSGFTTKRIVLTQSGIGGAALEANDGFGYALAAGNFNGQSGTDLAIGAPAENVGGVAYAGAVSIVYSGPAGLSRTGSHTFVQANGLITGTPETGDAFGWALAAGNLRYDIYDDLAIGVPFEDVGSTVNAGIFHYVYGTNAGLTAGGGFADLVAVNLPSVENAQYGSAFAWGSVVPGVPGLIVSAPQLSSYLGVPYGGIATISAIFTTGIDLGTSTWMHQ